LDEAVQYVLPNRVFEVRDAMINVFAALLGLLMVRALLRPDASGISFDEAKR
jgi:VanZ family protein